MHRNVQQLAATDIAQLRGAALEVDVLQPMFELDLGVLTSACRPIATSNKA